MLILRLYHDRHLFLPNCFIRHVLLLTDVLKIAEVQILMLASLVIWRVAVLLRWLVRDVWFLSITDAVLTVAYYDVRLGYYLLLVVILRACKGLLLWESLGEGISISICHNIVLFRFLLILLLNVIIVLLIILNQHFSLLLRNIQLLLAL